MKRKFILRVLCVLLAYACPIWEGSAKAEDKTFTSSGTITDGNVFEVVTVQNDGTVVDMSGGEIGIGYGSGLNMWDASIFNMSGGQIAGSIFINKSGTFNIFGGTINIGDYVVYDGAVLNIFGGNITAIQLKTYPASPIPLVPASIVNINGGIMSFDRFGITGILNIYRGLLSVDDFTIWGGDSASINIYGRDFNYNSSTQVLTGYLLDNHPFTIKGVGTSEYTKFNLIPEPASLLFFGFGLLALRKKKH